MLFDRYTVKKYMNTLWIKQTSDIRVEKWFVGAPCCYQVLGLENQQRTVRETIYLYSVSGNHVCLIDAPVKPRVHHSTIVLRDLRGVLNRLPIMPRHASLSNSECEFLFGLGRSFGSRISQ